MSLQESEGTHQTEQQACPVLEYKYYRGPEPAGTNFERVDAVQREARPFFRSDEGYWVFTDHNAIREALQDPSRFSNAERVEPITADLAVDAAVETVVPCTMERFGRLDILINNAGFGVPTPATQETADGFRRTLEVNLVAAFQLARAAAAPMLAAEYGTIVNIASILGLGAAWPIPNAAYTSSKGALVSLTKDLACQWAQPGVRVNALAPGYFPSESSAPMMEDETSLRYIQRNCPMRRMGHEHELDGAIVFLCSPASTYMTGQVLTESHWPAEVLGAIGIPKIGRSSYVASSALFLDGACISLCDTLIVAVDDDGLPAAAREILGQLDLASG